MSKIREEAEKAIRNRDTDNYLFSPSGCNGCAKQARRVLLMLKAYRYLRAAMKLRNYFENDAAWTISNGVSRGDDWYWWCIDACELNANILWNKAAELYKQAEEI